MTLRSRTVANFVRISFWMPSAKYVDVSDRDAINFSPLQLLEEAAHNGVRFLIDAQSPKTQVRLLTANRIRTYHRRWVNYLQSSSVVSFGRCRIVNADAVGSQIGVHHHRWLCVYRSCHLGLGRF